MRDDNDNLSITTALSLLLLLSLSPLSSVVVPGEPVVPESLLVGGLVVGRGGSGVPVCVCVCVCVCVWSVVCVS